jgi:cell division protein FtsI (penicillin-binding protein 3)
MRNLDPRRARWIKVRMGLLCGLMGVGLGLIVSSAYSVQLEDGDNWREMAEKQRQRRLHVVPKRGSVYDRNGTALAVSIEVPSVSMDCVELLRGADDRRALIIAKDAAMRMAKVLDVDAVELERKILLRRRFAWVKRRINKEEVEGIRALADPKAPLPIRGLVIEGEGHRFYPNRELGGPLLGFVSPDGEGKDGIELELDQELKGRVDQVRGLRDRSGRLLFSEGIQDEQALAGHNVYLTIDQGIQYTAEQELAAAVRTYEANWGAAIVVEPNTGEILALANAPGYNPNDYGTSEVEMRRNRAISDRFEPGSTMKIFTFAAALAAKTLSPTQTIFCEGGTMVIDNFVLHDSHVSGWLTPTQILALSSNIGAAKIGMALGEPQLYDALRRFGFGEPTEIPMPGEASGVLRPKGRPWVQVETAAVSRGYGIGVTALQLAMGVAAVANGGRLLEPLLIKRVTDGTGAVVREGVPHVRREAMPAPVARTLAEMMVAVTEGQGTGVEAAIAGFRVAGKTATAHKADPATGKYAEDRLTSSFIGFVPAERPRIAVVIVLDEPSVAHAGGFVAAPAFRRIGEMSLRYLGVIPRGTPPVAISKMTSGPDPAAAMYEAMRQAQLPEPPMKEIAMTNVPAPKGTVRVPDLKGMSLREATKSALDVGLLPALDGTGTLSRQDPAAGAVLPKGARVKLFFEPPT